MTEPTSDFHVHGFLGMTSDTNAIDFWNENPEWHELVLNLHSIAIAAFQKVQVGNRDPNDLLNLAVQPAVDGINNRMEALIARTEAAPEGNG